MTEEGGLHLDLQPQKLSADRDVCRQRCGSRENSGNSMVARGQVPEGQGKGAGRENWESGRGRPQVAG